MSDGVVLAIDPGKSGALVLMDRTKIHQCAVMPLIKGSGAKDLIDLGGVKQLFLNWMKELPLAIVAIEKQSPFPGVVIGANEKPCPMCGHKGHNTGSLANWNRGYSSGFLEMLCVCLGLRYALVGPQTWQAELLRDTNARDTKQAALVVAKRLWPNQNWLATVRSRKPHEGLVDAVLVGTYAARRFL